MHAPQPARSPVALLRPARAASMGLLTVLLLCAASTGAQAQSSGFARPAWAIDAADLEPDLSAVEDADDAPLVSAQRDPGEATQGGAAFIPFDLSGRTADDDAGARGEEASLFQSAVMMLAALAGIGWVLRLWWRTQ